MGAQRRQELPQFGGSGIVLDQQAPALFVHRTCLHMVAHARGQQAFDFLQVTGRLLVDVQQRRQRGRLLDGLHHWRAKQRFGGGAGHAELWACARLKSRA